MGSEHVTRPLLSCSPDAITELIHYCRRQGLSRFLIVSDRNTHAVLGRQTEARLIEQGWPVCSVILGGDDIVADATRVLEVLAQANGEEITYVAVGSGTITDITRYASFCARNPFISLPTAPSMDAYTSAGAALTLGGFKLTVRAHTPLAVFVDLPTLRAAPTAMIAAGFGDMLGKYISLADWKLGALLLDEPYSHEIVRRAERALHACVEWADDIGKATDEGIRTLTEALLDSGLCMAELGSSRPASGAEHCFSHFWEMTQRHRRSLLHGTKVGIGTVLAARRYAAMRRLSWEETICRLSAAPPPDPQQELAAIRATYGQLAERIVAEYEPFVLTLARNWDGLKQRMGEHWGDIQAIAAGVPPARALANLLRRAGGVSDPGAVGLSDRTVRQALASARYLRGRFTVDTLGWLLGLW